MATTVFWAWQSDLPTSTNRNFVENVLKRVLKGINAEVELETVLDRNADGVPGIPDIPSSIYTKIEHAEAFVCDVSIVNGRSRRRRTPNPNVLIELGYAMGIMGENHIIMVMYRAFGGVNSLPFDLDKRRVLHYDLPVNADNDVRERARSGLESALKDGLRAILVTARATRSRDNRFLIDAEIEQNRDGLVVLDQVAREAEQSNDAAFLESAALTLAWSERAWTDAGIRQSASLADEERRRIVELYNHAGRVRQRLAQIANAQSAYRESLRHYRSQRGLTDIEEQFGGPSRERHQFVALMRVTLIPQLQADIARALAVGHPLH